MTRRSLHPVSVRALVCLVAIGCLTQTGCVRRRLMVRSNPPGAMVYVDNQPIGTTPCATDFTYYGTREIRLVKAGYETLTVNQPLPAPWYQIPPLDFVSENIVPSKIQDYRTASFNMAPQVIVPTEQLIARGEQLRQSTLQGAALAAITTVGPSAGLIPVLPPGVAPNQPTFLSPAPGQTIPGQAIPGQAIPGQATPGQATPGQPTLGQPTLAPPVTFQPPGAIVAPPPGTGRLPIGGRPLEALPPPNSRPGPQP